MSSWTLGSYYVHNNMMDEKLPSSFTLCSIIAEKRVVMMVDTSIYKRRLLFLTTEYTDPGNNVVIHISDASTHTVFNLLLPRTSESTVVKL
jgi:hypothetical protein